MNKLMVTVAALTVATVLRAGYVLDFSGANPDNGNKKDTRVITDVQITTKDFTLEAWVKRNANQSGFKIFAQYPGQTYKLFLGAQDANQTTLDVFLSGATDPSWWQTGITIPLGEWTHVAMTKRQDDDGVNGTVKLFVNGVLKATKTEASLKDYCPSTNKSQLWLGNTYSDGNGIPGTYQNGFPGYMAEMRLWSVCRTDDEIASHYNRRLVGNETGLAGYWPLNEAAGQKVRNLVTQTELDVLGKGGWVYSDTFPVSRRTVVTSGFLDFDDPSDLEQDGVEVGSCTLRYTGDQPATVTAPIFCNVSANNKASIIWNERDLTLLGSVLQTGSNGALLKRGAGTLTLSGADNKLSAATDVGCNDKTRLPEDGNSPDTGMTGFSIVSGTVVLDGGKFSAQRTYIGRNTTDEAGAETAGHLVIRGNTTYTTPSSFMIGPGNGTTTTAPTPLESSCTIESGTVSVGNLVTVGNNPMNVANYNAHPVFNMNGGSLEIKHAGNGWLVIGESAGAWGTVNLNGGEITASRIYRGSGHATLHLNGTVIRMKKANGSDGYANLVASGFGGFDVLDVGAGGAIFDCVDPFRLKQAIVPMSGVAQDGGLTKRGEATLASTNGVVHTFTGPVRIEAGTYVGTLGKSNDLFVAEGAVYDPNGEKTTVGAFDCRGTIAAGTIEVTGAVSTNSAFTVAGTLMMAKTAAVDFGCTSESPAPLGTPITLGTVGTLAGKRTLGVVNTGRAGEGELRAYLTVENGTVKAVLGEKRGLCLIFK